MGIIYNPTGIKEYAGIMLKKSGTENRILFKRPSVVQIKRCRVRIDALPLPPGPKSYGFWVIAIKRKSRIKKAGVVCCKIMLPEVSGKTYFVLC